MKKQIKESRFTAGELVDLFSKMDPATPVTNPEPYNFGFELTDEEAQVIANTLQMNGDTSNMANLDVDNDTYEPEFVEYKGMNTSVVSKDFAEVIEEADRIETEIISEIGMEMQIKINDVIAEAANKFMDAIVSSQNIKNGITAIEVCRLVDKNK